MSSGERTASRVGLLTGGSTPERPVALAGARQVAASLRDRGYEVLVFDTTEGPLDARREAEVLREDVAREAPRPAELLELASREDLPRLVSSEALRGCDVVWPLLHGLQGEGGEVQSLLESAGLPFAGSDARGSTLAMDKVVAKILMEHAGVATPSWTVWRRGERPPVPATLPVVVKPSRVGSTVGLTLVERGEDVLAALDLAAEYDDEVLVEEFLPGRELTVGVLRGEALAVGEIRTTGKVFDFESKYQPGAAEEIFPAEVSESLAQSLREDAVRVHTALKLRDFCRVDFRLTAEGETRCLEANTLPGMTRTSLLPQSAAAAGMSFGDLCEAILSMALERRR